MPHPVEQLIYPRWIATVEPAGTVLTDHAIALGNGRIEEVLPASQARQRYASVPLLELPDHLLIPGLVNAHGHAAMALMRGMADDLPLMAWLSDHIWPAEAKHVSAEYVRDGSMLAFAEQIRAGVTTVNDMYFFPEASAQAAIALGMRATLGIITIEFPTAYAASADEYLRKGLAARDAVRGEELIRFSIAPHAPYTVSDATFLRVITLAEELDLPIHCHINETAFEVEQSVKEHGKRPLERLHALGIVGPRLIAVHAVHLNEAEIAQFAELGVHVAHCPASNLKLASGIAPIAALEKAGVNITIGTDGAASNNSLDLLAEARLAALLAKGASGDATAMNAHRTLAAMTLNGARALGLEGEIGSIAAGKRADLTAIDLSAIETQPVFDPVSHLIYAAGREQVTHVWVNGECVLNNRRITRADEREILDRAHYWKQRLSS